ncbi:hypothetical protein AWV79_36870 [Cupriavidus sp. UYMMa02A]|nr:hypothetical protein AWV79_36870 [Cupriavidus sp. UYMMa02A]
MSQFIHTIKFRIILVFSICIALMLAIGLFALQTISGLNQNMHDAYEQNTVAIGELADVRVAQLHIRRLLWKLRATSEEASSADLALIREYHAKMQKGWQAYYPARVTSARERSVADALTPRSGGSRTLSRRRCNCWKPATAPPRHACTTASSVWPATRSAC